MWIPSAITGYRPGLFLFIGTFSPLFSAIIVAYLLQGKSDLQDIFSRVKKWKVGIRWYVFALFCTAAVTLSAVGIHVFLGGIAEFPLARKELWVIPVAFIYVFVFSVLGEEPGWWGFLLPALIKRTAPAYASLGVAIAWGLWHLPLFFTEGNMHQDIPILLFLVQITAFSFLYTWMHIKTYGSLLIVMVFHAASNATLGIVPVLPQQAAGSIKPLGISVAMLVIITAYIIWKEKAVFQKKPIFLENNK